MWGIFMRLYSRCWRQILLLLLASIGLSACIAKKDLILPTRYDRQKYEAQYKQCITQSTNANYNSVSTPQELLKASFDNCRGVRQIMIRSYPKRWHENWASKIDQEIYKSELAWIQNKRN
jgi:hypothetical protein